MSEQMQSEIARLSIELTEVDDPRQAWKMVKERINAYRQLGWEIPDDLTRMERQCMAECLAESQGR